MLKRWLVAFGAALVAALGITALVSRASRPLQNWDGDAIAIWRTRTGVDLARLPRRHPAQPDNEKARALDALLQPLGLRLGERWRDPRPPDPMGDDEGLRALRDALRDAIRSETTEVKALPATAVAAIESRARTLDAVADSVATHGSIRWREDLEPRAQLSRLYLGDHLNLHRLLIGRAFLAMERGDVSTAARMLATSQELGRALARRQELWSHLTAIGVERLQLALIRRSAGALGSVPAETSADIRARFVELMSVEAAVTLANARHDGSPSDESDPAVRIVRVLAKPKLQLAASEVVRLAAEDVAEIVRSPDGCAEVAKQRRRPSSFFAGDFFTVNAAEAWRLFIVLELDRAITAAVLTGQTSSPCPSVTITATGEGEMRTVTAKGLPPLPENMVALPAVVRRQ